MQSLQHQPNDIWVYLFSNCSNQYLNNLCTNRHNNILHALLRLLKSHPAPGCYIITHANNDDDTPLNNTVPLWLFLCTFYKSRCTCFARLQPYILCIHGTLPHATPPFHPFSISASNTSNPHIAVTTSLRKPLQSNLQVPPSYQTPLID